MYIAIAGNIGAGKTTLAELMAKNYKWKVHYEDVEHNPYLDDFYNNMNRWAFNLQIYFLTSRLKHLKDITESKGNYIQDRTIYEDAYIFAANLKAMGLLSSRDYDNYLSLFELMEDFIKPPDLMIYLRASVPSLVENIHRRGREYESSISIDYLSRLNERYEAWIETYDKGKKIIIDVDDLDFVKNEDDFAQIIEKIEANIHGLF